MSVKTDSTYSYHRSFKSLHWRQEGMLIAVTLLFEQSRHQLNQQHEAESFLIR
jgi:hypothetical protein